ncbi:MAG: sugar lactone lactonase YvrE [Granulosicoccus sp.]|jgi:sugar lactone lactonase YvrE
MSNIETVVYIENSCNGQPVWIDTQSSLFWIEHNQQKLYQYHEPSKEITHCALDQPILSLSPSIKNGFIATLKDGIGFFDIKTRSVSYISKPEPFLSDFQSTGGIADSKGNYWTSSSISNNGRQQSHIYQLTPGLSLDRFSHEGIESVAEPAFSKDGKTLYQSTKNGQHVYATQLNEQLQPISTEVFCRISKSEGQPHGLCVDSEDNLWVCHLGGGCISCYNNEGNRIEKISVLAPNVMHCTFGGEDLDTLYIATNGTGYDQYLSKKQSMTGCILSIKVGKRGLKANCFSG